MSLTKKELKGPKGYPIVGNLPKIDLPRLHIQVEEWSKEFGDLFYLDLGLGGQIVVTRPSLIQKINTARPNTFMRLNKMNDIIKSSGVHGVFNAEGEEWKLHRRIIAKGLDVRHQKEFYPSMEVTIERLYNKWKKNAESSQPFDILQDLFRFTVDITSSLAFGMDMNTLEEEGGVIQDHMNKIFPMIFKRINMPIPWYKLMRTKNDREFERAVMEMNKLVDQFIEQGTQKIKDNPGLRENPSNLLESILVAAEDEPEFKSDHVRGNLLTLLMAGEDTTATALAWFIYLMTQHDNIIPKLRDEANSVLGDYNWLSNYEDHSKLRYTEAASHESMRFKPVAPIVLHEVAEDVELEEIQFKKGDRILTQYRVGGMKDEYFTDAFKFNPDRWLKEGRCPVHNMQAHTPFGGGARYCPGRNLALLEMQMVISMLVKNFDIEMVTPHNDIKENMAFTMMPDNYWVRLKPVTA